MHSKNYYHSVKSTLLQKSKNLRFLVCTVACDLLNVQDLIILNPLIVTTGLIFMETDVVAVLGPESSTIAHVIFCVVNELQVPLVSFATDH